MKLKIFGKIFGFVLLLSMPVMAQDDVEYLDFVEEETAEYDEDWDEDSDDDGSSDGIP